MHKENSLYWRVRGTGSAAPVLELRSGIVKFDLSINIIISSPLFGHQCIYLSLYILPILWHYVTVYSQLRESPPPPRAYWSHFFGEFFQKVHFSKCLTPLPPLSGQAAKKTFFAASLSVTGRTTFRKVYSPRTMQQINQ